MFKSKEFRRSIMPVIVFNSIFCTGLFEYFVDQWIHVIGFIYVSFVATGYCLLFHLLDNIMNELWANQESDFTLLTMHFQFVHNIIVYLSTVFAGIIRRKHVRLSMKQLENCTRAMDELGIPGSYSPLFTHKYLVIFFFSSILISAMTNELIYFISSDQNYVIIILYCLTDNIPPVTSFIVDFSFVYWIRYTKIKLGQLNTVLRSMLTTTIDSPQHRRVLRVRDKWKDSSTSSNISPNSKANENVRKLRRIKHIHLELIKFARNTNKAYGLHILISMTTCFLLITTLSYNLYIGMVSTKSILNVSDVFTYTYWTCFLAFETFVVNHICEITAMETRRITVKIFIIFPHAAETGDILCELYEPSASKEFRDVVREFTYQIIQNPLTFTACGFFDLNHTFINNTIGSVTTYLVILIQVGHGLKTQSKNSTENSTASSI